MQINNILLAYMFKRNITFHDPISQSYGDNDKRLLRIRHSFLERRINIIVTFYNGIHIRILYSFLQYHHRQL